jgi:hypothetical protein
VSVVVGRRLPPTPPSSLPAAAVAVDAGDEDASWLTTSWTTPITVNSSSPAPSNVASPNRSKREGSDSITNSVQIGSLLKDQTVSREFCIRASAELFQSAIAAAADISTKLDDDAEGGEPVQSDESPLAILRRQPLYVTVQLHFQTPAEAGLVMGDDASEQPLTQTFQFHLAQLVE